MDQENFNHDEGSPELTTERRLEIAIAYIRDEVLRQGKIAPHFNSPEMRERIKNTISQKHLSEIGVTEEEAFKFLQEILSE